MKYKVRRSAILILIVGLLAIGMQACGESTDTPHDNKAVLEEPAMTIFNDSMFDISIHYNLDSKVKLEVIISSGETYEIESGVTKVTIDDVYTS